MPKGLPLDFARGKNSHDVAITPHLFILVPEVGVATPTGGHPKGETYTSVSPHDFARPPCLADNTIGARGES
ncbi:MAG: hypothetical protein COY11_02930 [Candidatus Portnoybacteria bacterium CG_4_10_14_0_2_um_filter_44_20]|uniref:Uncharacterized protein n=1 Tax=Candidatus Portnoybacteria bacterium CG_4_10_14_0_2_um_filter_44_20 TaxID=1974799 RepID=A0A2M7UGC4_9BACT|nr:MAG: hypothetical protein COY11_02930 [Candidatus Portnoybacteria bacterium CG_4_10_14_0_2_um_filter_44_20]